MHTLKFYALALLQVALREPVRVVGLLVLVADLVGLPIGTDNATALQEVLETLAILGVAEGLRQFTSPARAATTEDVGV